MRSRERLNDVIDLHWEGEMSLEKAFLEFVWVASFVPGFFWIVIDKL